MQWADICESWERGPEFGNAAATPCVAALAASGHPLHCTPSLDAIGLSPCRVAALLACGTEPPSAHTTPALPRAFLSPGSSASPRLVILSCRTTSPGDWDPAGLGSMPYGMLLILSAGTLGFWLLAEHTAFFKSGINSNTNKGRSSSYFFSTLLLYSPYVVPIGGIWALSKVSAAWLASVPSTYGLQGRWWKFLYRSFKVSHFILAWKNVLCFHHHGLISPPL